MREIKFKTILWLILLFIFLTVYAITSANMKQYTKEYTIENFVSDYQYVVKEDANIRNHTVGAIAIGGKAKVSSFGDAAIENSWIGYVESYGNYSRGSYFRDSKYKEYYDKYYAYYKDSSYSGELSGLTKINSNYIDFDKAYTMIKMDSEKLSVGYSVTVKKETIDGQEGYALYVPDKKSVVITSDEWDKCDFVILDGSLKDFIKSEHTISILSDKVSIGADYSYVSVGDSKKAVFAKDGNKLKLLEHGNGLMQLKDGAIQGGQLNVNGMKLVWNMPKATNVVTEYLPGHVVAPSAKVKINGGNFEGSYIAKSLESSAEGHFYPYNEIEKIKITPSPSVVTEKPSATPTIAPTKTPNVSLKPTEEPTNTPTTASTVAPTATVTPTTTPTGTINVTSTPVITLTSTPSNTPNTEIITSPTPRPSSTPLLDIKDNDIPKGNKDIKDKGVSKKTVDISEDIPLSDVPNTGDNFNPIVLAIFITCGILIVALICGLKEKGNKKEN